MLKISVIGLGKLGSPILAACAHRGFEVVGLDVNKMFVELVNQSKAPVDEPKLTETIEKNKGRITATTDYNKAILETDISFVIVPTPSKKSGAFSNKYVLSAVRNIGKALSNKGRFHVVVIVSTVLPTSCDKEIIPAIEKISAKKAGLDFGVCYNPEFIALGSVIDNLLSPDLVLIGESDEKSGEIMEKFYKKFCINKPRVFRMNLVNAEIAKIALNSYITTKISFANTLAELCQNIPGGDVDQITSAIGQDSRVGNKYFKGGLPFGGPCFPRDNRAFSYFANKQKIKTPLATATDVVNKRMSSSLINQIVGATNPRKKIGILGLSYKKDTDVVEESPGIKVANVLAGRGLEVYVWDPKSLTSAKKLLTSKVKISRSLEDCVDCSEIIVIMTPWDEFKNIRLNRLKRKNEKPILLDCWKILDQLKYQKVAEYRTIGRSPK